MSKILSLGLALALSTTASAQTAAPAPATPPPAKTQTPPMLQWPAWFTQRGTTVPLWPEGKMPGVGNKNPENYRGAQPGSVIIVTNVSQPTLEIFKAPNATGPVPAVIICPGGGYNILAYNLEGTEIAAWLNKLGITGIVLKYRVPGNRDGAFQDVERAMRLARQHAADWGIRADKLGVCGFSAGGHLAARLSTNYNTPVYAPLDAADQQSCRPDFAMLLYPAYLNKNGVIVPEMMVTSTTPPTFLGVALNDKGHVADSQVYDAALDAANVPQELHVYATGGHGFGLRSKVDAKVWPDQAAAWLKKIGIL